MVNNIVIILYEEQLVIDISRRSFHNVYKCQTNKILHINHIFNFKQVLKNEIITINK